MNVVVVFGGKSVEHEISIISAYQVMEAMRIKYNVIPVYISKDNKFYYHKKMNDISYFKSNKNKTKKSYQIKFKVKNGRYYIVGRNKIKFDIVFPIVHGKGSEDGTILNYFRFIGIPVVGNSASFYAIAQDKALTKRVLDGMNIDNVKYKLIKRWDDYSRNDFTFPCIVKPNNLGSSLGISVARNYIELEKAVAYCFKVDSEVLVEEYLEDCKEYNIAVLNDNGEIKTSEIDEVIKGEIFTYKEKYLTGNKKSGWGSKVNTKRNTVNKTLQKQMEKIAKEVYKNFNASGVIRIDFLYKDKLYLNEINSIPGSYAYYLWENKYDFLELLDISIKEARRNNYFLNKDNELIIKNVIFPFLNNR